jgi:D-alanine transaminase
MLEEISVANVAFHTAASQFVMPITEIDGHRIGGGQPGPVVRKLRELFLKEAGSVAKAFQGLVP